MPFPALTHVAVTVTDLDASTRWYTQLFGAEPVLDEDESSGTFHHAVYALDGGTLFGVHTHNGSTAPVPSTRRAPAWTTSPSPSVGMSSTRGWLGWTSWESATAVSRTRRTAPGSHSETLTTSRWSSSRRLSESPRRYAGRNADNLHYVIS